MTLNLRGNQMSRIQLPVNVSDSNAAVAFRSRLLGAVPPELRPGYANFALDVLRPGATCCNAREGTVRPHDPGGLAWEYYTVLEHIETP
jgi:hypothetical protein